MATSPRPWVASYPGFKTPGGGGGSSGNGSGLVCPKCSFPVTLVPLNEGILSIEVRFVTSNCPVKSACCTQFALDNSIMTMAAPVHTTHHCWFLILSKLPHNPIVHDIRVHTCRCHYHSATAHNARWASRNILCFDKYNGLPQGLYPKLNIHPPKLQQSFYIPHAIIRYNYY